MASAAKYTSIYQGVNPYRICQEYCDNPQNMEIFLQKSKVFVDICREFLKEWFLIYHYKLFGTCGTLKIKLYI